MLLTAGKKSMTDILQRIVVAKLHEIAAAKAKVPQRELEQRLAAAPPVRVFRSALEKGPGLGIIAEVKKASPSAGILRDPFDPLEIARIYEAGGAHAISVLTDEPFFQGKLAYLTAIRQAVSIPVLRKDFILDSYQIIEARVAGADAVLLIAEILEGEQLPALLHKVEKLGMQALVELYDPENLARVVDSGARIIGVNNRNLRTFETKLEHTLDLLPHMPKDACVVNESGIRNRADMERLQAAGVKAVLIGETFMKAPDIAAKLREMRGCP
jgi:indole-3-glycerol phosphate synthase